MSNWKGSNVHGTTTAFVQNITPLQLWARSIHAATPEVRESISEGFVTDEYRVDNDGTGPDPFDCGSLEVPGCQVDLTSQQLNALAAAHDVLAPNDYNGLDIYVEDKLLVL